MHAYGFVGFIKDGKVEFYARVSCRRSQPATALIGGEYDFGPSGRGTKQCRNLITVSVRRQTEVINLADKFVALKVTDRLIAANTKPIRLNAVGKEFTGPVGQALAHQG